MLDSQLQAFISKASTDPELQKKLQSIADFESFMALAKDAGFAISEKELRTFQSDSVDALDEEMTTKDLKAIFGGASFKTGTPINISKAKKVSTDIDISDSGKQTSLGKSINSLLSITQSEIRREI